MLGSACYVLVRVVALGDGSQYRDDVFASEQPDSF